MIRSRLPQCIIALHTLIPDQNILHGIVQGMPHMKLPGDVWRRHHDGEGLLAPVHLRVKIFVVLPFLVKSVLDSLRIVGLCQFSAHFLLLSVLSSL